MVGELLRARPRAMMVLAMLLIGLGLTLGLGREALADYSFRCATSGCGSQMHGNTIDYDGFVKEYYGDPVSGHYDGKIGYAWRYYDGRYHRWIEYDAVEMRNHCANSTTWSNLYAHERAHTRGWSHWEAPASWNAAYNSTVYWPC